MTSLPDEPGAGRLRGVVLLLALGQLVSSGFPLCAFALFIGPLEPEQGWSRTEVTGALTAGLLATAATSSLAGRLIDRFGGHLPMTGARSPRSCC